MPIVVMDMKLSGMGNEIIEVEIILPTEEECMEFIARGHNCQHREPGQSPPGHTAYLKDILSLVGNAKVVYPLSARLKGDPPTGLVSKHTRSSFPPVSENTKRLRQGPALLRKVM